MNTLYSTMQLAWQKTIVSFFLFVAYSKTQHKRKCDSVNVLKQMDLCFLENNIFQTHDFCTASQSIQVKKQLLKNFKSIFKFLAIAEVEGINYTHQQGTASWNVPLNQTYVSLYNNCCFPAIWGWPFTNDGDFHHDLIIIFKAGLELFVVLLKKK